MLHHIPRPRREETLYSAIARFGRYLGDVDAAPFMAGLFGRRHAIASSELPGGLAAFAGELEVDRRDAAIDTLIDGLTLFPFYTAFLPESLRARTRAAMRGDMTGVHARLGLAAFRIRPPDQLRFCSDCLDEMEAERGDPWWRRDHQMAGVPVCPEHGTALRLSSVAQAGSDRHRFVPASRDVCRADAPLAVVAGEADMARLHGLARAAADLLQTPPAAAEFATTSQEYRRRLGEAGLMRSPRKVDQLALRDAFTSHWGNVPGLLKLGTDEAIEGSWLVALVRSGRRAAHPVQHLMLRGLLDHLPSVPTTSAFGQGPWECRNPIADHFARAVIVDLEIRRGRGRTHGRFACSCGYVYGRTLSPDGAIGAPRFHRFGALLGPALTDAIQSGASLRATAECFGVDPKTLMREAAIAGVEVPWGLRPSGRVPELRLSPADPKRRAAPRHRGRARRNWFAIDTKLARSAREASGQIMAAVPPVRITFAAVEARIARRDWIVKRRLKLPQTVLAINRAIETVHEFRMRRLQWCVDQAVAAGDFRAAEVMRAAGLPTGWIDVVRDEIGRALVRRSDAA